jgi:prefoldin beta subunit
MANTTINQLQLFQQNLQNIVQQKQMLESQVMEIDSALEELKTTSKSYKILGKVMLVVSSEKLNKELQDKKEVLQLRVSNFEKQEMMLTKNIEQLQQEVVNELKKK